MQEQRASLKRSASGAFAQQQEVQATGARNSQSPKMSSLRAGRAVLVPHQSQSNGLPGSPSVSNGNGHPARDQYQYPTQADLLSHMPQNLESTALLNDYRDQGNHYFKEQMTPSPAASKAMPFNTDGHLNLVKYNNNNTLGEYPPGSGYAMHVPPQGYPSQEDELDRQALRAKRDAEAKRKQIPPFVQKLSR